MMGKIPRIFPSKAYREWDKAVRGQLLMVRQTMAAPFNVPVSCCALFYRETAIGDSCGFYQALGDSLEAAGIVTNDRLIEHWDGSRLLKDKLNPRVVVTLNPIGQEQLL